MDNDENRSGEVYAGRLRVDGERNARPDVDADREASEVDPHEPTEIVAPPADNAVHLYDPPTGLPVHLNPRTDRVLQLWFDAAPGSRSQNPVAVEPERELSALVPVAENARWTLMVIAFASTMAFWVGLVAGWPDELVQLLLTGGIGGGAAAVGVDRFAKNARAKHDKRRLVEEGLSRSRMRAVQGTGGWPAELRLALHVAQLAHEIENSPAFTSDYLNNHRRRINLGEEVDQLTRDAIELWAERRTVTVRDELAVPDSAALTAVLDAQEQDLREVWGALTTRTSALERYLQKVREMEPRLAHLDQLQSAATRSDRIADLKYRTVEHQQAADEIDGMVAELSAVREAIDQLVRGLDRDAEVLEARPGPGTRPPA